MNFVVRHYEGARNGGIFHQEVCSLEQMQSSMPVPAVGPGKTVCQIFPQSCGYNHKIQ